MAKIETNMDRGRTLDMTLPPRRISNVPNTLVHCPLCADPFEQFEQWFARAQLIAPTTADVMALATASRRGAPSVRYVLYKGIRSGGFSFFTHYDSRKAREIATNPVGA